MKQKKKNNKMRTFCAEYVDLLYRDNYRHVLVLDSVDGDKAVCVISYSQNTCILSRSNALLSCQLTPRFRLQFFNSQNIYHSTN